MSRAEETAMGAAITVSGRSTAEGLGGGKIWSAASARRPASPAGEIFSPDRLEAGPAGSSPTETCRNGLAETPQQRRGRGYSPGTLKFRSIGAGSGASRPQGTPAAGLWFRQ